MQRSQLYPCDRTGTQVSVLEPAIPKPVRRERKRTPWRAVLKAIFYVLRSGGAWRLLHKELSAVQTVYDWFRRWQQHGVWQRISRYLVRQSAAARQ